MSIMIPATEQSPATWLASLALILASGPDAPVFNMETADPVLDLERQWLDLEDQQAPLEREFNELNDALARRVGGDPQEDSYRKRWRRDPMNKRLEAIDAELSRLVDRQSDIRDKIVNVTATSLAGLIAKIRIVAHFSREEAAAVAAQPVTIRALNDLVRLVAEVPV